MKAQGTPARVVMVSSTAHGWPLRGAWNLEDLNWHSRKYNNWAAYTASKLANVLFAQELAKR